MRTNAWYWGSVPFMSRDRLRSSELKFNLIPLLVEIVPRMTR